IGCLSSGVCRPPLRHVRRPGRFPRYAPQAPSAIFPGMTALAGKPDLETFLHHWQDEADAAFLYRVLASVEPDAVKRDVYQRLAEVEDRHTVIWEDVITKNGGRVGKFSPAGRTRLLAWLGQWFGPGFLLPML